MFLSHLHRSFTGFVKPLNKLVIAVAANLDDLCAPLVCRAAVVGPPTTVSVGPFSRHARDGCHSASGDGEQ